jgi:hypothetical protein
MEKRLKDFVWLYAKTKQAKNKYNNIYKNSAMIKEVCNDLKTALLEGVPLNLVDTFAGLAQVVTYKNPDENGNIVTKKMPVSYDTEGIGCVPNTSREKDLVPNSRKKGIIYFEDNGGMQIIRNLSGGCKQYRGNVVLVCWMNRKKSVGETYTEVGKAAFDEIMEKLSGVLLSQWFINLKASAVRFRQDPQVFNKYTYDETVLQFLRPPFEYFAIDLSVTFITSCKVPITLNPQEC